MSEIPSFFVAVPSPAGIRVGIMASAGASVWAGLSACWKMSPVRGGMGNHGSAITGDGEVVGIDQSKAQGREDGKDGKDLLKSHFRIFGGGFPSRILLTISLVVMEEGSSGSVSLPSGPISFFGFLPFLPAGSREDLE